VVAWGTLAENAAASLAKGNRVLVTGRLDQRSWETEAGERRSKVEVSAEDLASSLRWATAKLARTERHGAEERPGPPAPSGYGPDEEPY
jgi:single-strand DNA-binding protein